MASKIIVQTYRRWTMNGQRTHNLIKVYQNMFFYVLWTFALFLTISKNGSLEGTIIQCSYKFKLKYWKTDAQKTMSIIIIKWKNIFWKSCIFSCKINFGLAWTNRLSFRRSKNFIWRTWICHKLDHHSYRILEGLDWIYTMAILIVRSPTI